MKYWLLFSLLLQSGLVFADPLSERLAGFSIIKESRGLFVEAWSADYLDEPLISKGELLYIRPGQLSKFITDPDHIEQHIKGNQLTVIHNGEARIIQLSEQPVLAAGVFALKAVLDGDENVLRKLFEIKYSEIESDWTLSLVPKDKQVADTIGLIVFHGSGSQIYQVVTQFNNGDSLVSEITHGP
jgi:hypothetical protein